MNLVFSQNEKDVFMNISVMKPQYSNNGSNSSTYTGDAILLYTKWDDNVNLSHAILSTNETGAWKNYTDGTYGSPKTLGNLSIWSNFTWQNTTIVGTKVVGWKIYANDTEGYENVTGEMNFTVNIPTFVGLNLSAAMQRGILFGDVTGNTNNNLAENNTNSTSGAYNITEYWIGNDPSSTGPINLWHYASDMDRSGGSEIILIANVTHESNKTQPDHDSNVNMTNVQDGEILMTSSYTQIGDGNCSSLAKGDACWVAYWLDVPPNIPSGTYNTTYNYCGNLTSESTVCP